VFCQHAAAEWVNLALGNGSKCTRTFQTEFKAANASKEREKPQFFHHSPRFGWFGLM
jgi:hypothetical protein